jgi:hypothetical protein
MAHAARGQFMDTSMRREFWMYKPTGRAWAVELRDDVIVGAAGPLDFEDARPIILEYLDYLPYEGMWVNEHRGQFVRCDTDAAA